METYYCQRERHCLEADLNQCWYCASDRPLPGYYTSIPGEVLTITRKKYGHHPYGCKITSTLRGCYGAEHVYFSGLSDPNYPVPAIVYEFDPEYNDGIWIGYFDSYGLDNAIFYGKGYTGEYNIRKLGSYPADDK